jgi:hypothetical protein
MMSSTIYEHGEFTQVDDGKNEFTKMTTNINEIHIYNMLRTTRQTSSGIVGIVQVTNNSIKLEQLDICLDNYRLADIKRKMVVVKDYLQSMGIMYIDWKRDNMGTSRVDGNLRLFDFDGSGIIDLETNEWSFPAPKMWAYRDAIDAGMKTPKEIDDYAFNKAFSPKIKKSPTDL